MSYQDLPDPKQQSDGSWAVQYQTKDEAGKVIATTTLTGKSEKEVWKKIQAAHSEATAAVARLRARKQVEKPADLLPAQEESWKLFAQKENVKKDQASLAFLKRHLYSNDYNPCEANAQMLFSYLDARGLAFTADNLEIAFEELTREGRLVLPPQVQVEKAPEPEPPPAPMDVPWSPNPLTKKGIKDLGRSYSEFYNHKNLALRAEFRRQVDNALRGE